MQQDYNTHRNKLTMAEYGRNIQNMVKFAMSVPDRAERNIIANAIVTVMGQVNPQLREREELESKLWVHLYIISNYQLDVDYPCELPTKAEIEQKPQRLAYPQTRISHRYYGKAVGLFLEQVKAITDNYEKQQQLLILANLMKRQYIAYNHECSDDGIIKEHIRELSKGELSIDAHIKLQDVRALPKQTPPTTYPKKKIIPTYPKKSGPPKRSRDFD